LLALANTVILSPKSHCTAEHILLSDGSGSLQQLYGKACLVKLLWCSPAKSFMVMIPAEIMVIYHCATTLGEPYSRYGYGNVSTAVPGFEYRETLTVSRLWQSPQRFARATHTVQLSKQ
jgi:hypothetical protein